MTRNSELKLWWLVRDFDSRFVNWRYVFCASGNRDVDGRIRAEFESRYGYKPAAVRRVRPTGRRWLAGPVKGET